MSAANDNRQSLLSLGRILVVGLGVTGISVVRYLSGRALVAGLADGRSHVPGIEELQQLAPDAVVYQGDLDTVDCSGFDTVLLSPGVPRRSDLVLRALELGLEVIGDIELFARAADAPVIAVTGSNGKSTTVHLLTQMALAAGKNPGLGGNFGVPALDLLGQGHDVYVLELSSFQLESTVSLKASAAVVLNVSPDHLDRYESIAEYAHYKGLIYHNARKTVVNRDDDMASGLVEKLPTLTFGLNEPKRGQDYGLQLRDDGRTYLVKGATALLAADELKLVGRHNQANALAALALGELVELDFDAMVATLRRYTGLDHRTQWVAEMHGVTWLNDSKGTNTGATVAALEGLEHPVVLIVGGQAKGADFLDLVEPAAARCRCVLVMGEDAGIIERALTGRVMLKRVENMQQAIVEASRIAQPGDYVLLSPACASFDMYKGYAARGQHFVECVLGLQEVIA